jgi:hypothetical protein
VVAVAGQRRDEGRDEGRELGARRPEVVTHGWSGRRG